MNGSVRAALAITAAAVFCVALAQAAEPDSEPGRRIAVWGSSVANGVGDEPGHGGYAGRLGALLEARGWAVFNQSHNGDNTRTIAERFTAGDAAQPDTDYLTAVAPDYVIIGLSLGNEGIAQCQLGQTHRCTSTMGDAEAVMAQFTSGLQSLIERSRAAGIAPIVALPYARSDFWEREYAFTRRVNLLISAWDVPSINMLGAVDDGQGRWARGVWGDPFHPNAAGHREMLHAVVPTLFAALEAGKPVPAKIGNGYARVRADIDAPVTYSVDDTMRSFTLTFAVRPESEGVIAAVSGNTLDANYSIVRRSYGDFSWDTESLDLAPSTKRFDALLDIESGELTYTSSAGSSISLPFVNPGKWQYVTVTHYVARGETLLYVNGQLAGKVAEHLQPDRFVIGGPGANASGNKAARADYRDLMIHRAGSTGDEVAALHGGALLRASLEVYAPLSAQGSPTSFNLAQSLVELAVHPEVRFLSSD